MSVRPLGFPDRSKTRMLRWIDPVDPDIDAAVCALTPCDDRNLQVRVSSPTLRTRGCVRRLHAPVGHYDAALATARSSAPPDFVGVLRGTPIPRVAAYVGHARGSMTIDTCAYVLIERRNWTTRDCSSDPPPDVSRRRSGRGGAMCCQASGFLEVVPGVSPLTPLVRVPASCQEGSAHTPLEMTGAKMRATVHHPDRSCRFG
jgi:hypothetical protein